MHPDEIREQTSNALHRGNANLKYVPSAYRSLRWFLFILATGFLAMDCSAQDQVQGSSPSVAKPAGQLNVNWFYGSYVPKEVALMPLDGHQRFKLYLRQTYTTPGIYIKTALFAIHDQISDSNPEWGDDFQGFAKRLANRQVQFIIQNSISSLGNGVLGWEPRYNRCQCNGFWPRTRHAIVRNFVTYDQTEISLRPQIMPYVGAFGAASIASAWQPNNPKCRYEGTRQQSRRFLLGQASTGSASLLLRSEGFSRKRRSE